MAGLRNCIYALKDTRDNKIRYLGKTVCELKKRLREHLQDSRRHNTKCSRWVFGRIERGFDIIMVPIMCDIDTLKWEKRLIKKFRNKNFNLLNMTDGGDGVPGSKQSEATKLKKSIAMSGKKKSPEHIRKMSEVNTLPIHLYTMDGMFHRTFYSLSECVQYIGRCKSAIQYAVKRNGHCGDYRVSRDLHTQVPPKIKYYKPTSANALSNGEDMVHSL